MKKLLLSILLVCCVMGLSACSSQKVVKVENAKAEEISNLIQDFATMNGFKLVSVDKERQIYKVETITESMYQPLTNKPMLTLDAGFGIKLKQVNNDVLINARSYGYSYMGYVYNKTGRFLKSLKQEGYTVSNIKEKL